MKSSDPTRFKRKEDNIIDCEDQSSQDELDLKYFGSGFNGSSCQELKAEDCLREETRYTFGHTSAHKQLQIETSPAFDDASSDRTIRLSECFSDSQISDTVPIDDAKLFYVQTKIKSDSDDATEDELWCDK